MDHRVLSAESGPDLTTLDLANGAAAPRGSARGRRNRADAEPTIQVSLRLPGSWVSLLRDRALTASRAESCMITPQEIMRRIIAEALKTPE